MVSTVIGAGLPTIDDIVHIARQGSKAVLAAAAIGRIEAAAGTVARLAAEGRAIYGVSTGLGAAVDTRIVPDDRAVQHRIPAARAVGVGRFATTEEVRAIMAARVVRLAAGRSGASVAVCEALCALLNHRIHPRIPMTGSVGEGDLSALAEIAMVLIGEGEAEQSGAVLPGAEALAAAGLLPVSFATKDGLAMVSSNAASVGLAALAVADAEQALAAQLAAIALSFEAYRASLDPLRDAAITLRPVPGQADVAAQLWKSFAGGDLEKPGAARRLQDPLSFRCVVSIDGALHSAIGAARTAVELELGTSDDNPAILAETLASQPNANFDMTHVALSFETLGLAMARSAAAAGERIMKLMSPASSDLPRFLSPLQGGRNGFATLQKTISAIMAEIQHAAMPMPVYAMPVADRVEDYATMALGIVEKTAGIVARLRLLAAIELIVAGQACDLRAGITLGRGSRIIHQRLREIVPVLDEDRPTAPDIRSLDEAIRAGRFSLGTGAEDGEGRGRQI